MTMNVKYDEVQQGTLHMPHNTPPAKSRQPARSWTDAMTACEFDRPVNIAILRGISLVVEKCLNCGRKHTHGAAGAKVGDLEHRAAHCQPQRVKPELREHLGKGYHLRVVADVSPLPPALKVRKLRTPKPVNRGWIKRRPVKDAGDAKL